VKLLVVAHGTTSYVIRSRGVVLEAGYVFLRIGSHPTPIILEFVRVATGGGCTIRFQCFGERQRLDVRVLFLHSVGVQNVNGIHDFFIIWNLVMGNWGPVVRQIAPGGTKVGSIGWDGCSPECESG